MQSNTFQFSFFKIDLNIFHFCSKWINKTSQIISSMRKWILLQVKLWVTFINKNLFNIKLKYCDLKLCFFENTKYFSFKNYQKI
jgi:hypothetical protein